MAALGLELFRRLLEASSGRLTVGERAKHSQVSIWRNWSQAMLDQGVIDDASSTNRLLDGLPLAIKGIAVTTPKLPAIAAFNHREGVAMERLCLLMPTSLCSGQIAQLIAKQLNARLHHEHQGQVAGVKLSGVVDRFVALAHTEGCGTGYAKSEGADHYTRSVLGHLLHPSVRMALLLEHGCEHHHNDFITQSMKSRGLDPSVFGWASVQADGGIAPVTQKVTAWVEGRVAVSPPSEVRLATPLARVVIAILTLDVELPEAVVSTFASVIRQLVRACCTVVLPARCTLLQNAQFLDDVMEAHSVRPSLAYAQLLTKRGGVHIMDSPSTHWVETLTGLCASGCQLALTYSKKAMQGHPMLPMVRVMPPESTAGSASASATPATPITHTPSLPAHDASCSVSLPDVESKEVAVSDRLAMDVLGSAAALLNDAACYDGAYAASVTRNVDFQITRGLLGCSV